jgi:hypothetical protein
MLRIVVGVDPDGLGHDLGDLGLDGPDPDDPVLGDLGILTIRLSILEHQLHQK